MIGRRHGHFAPHLHKVKLPSTLTRRSASYRVAPRRPGGSATPTLIENEWKLVAAFAFGVNAP